MPLDGEAVASGDNLREGHLIGLGHENNPCRKDILASSEHRVDRIHESGILSPFLRLFLEHHPDADAVSDASLGIPGRTGNDRRGHPLVRQQVAKERVGVEFTFKKSSPRHHGVGIVPAAITMLDRIFIQRSHICDDG